MSGGPARRTDLRRASPDAGPAAPEERASGAVATALACAIGGFAGLALFHGVHLASGLRVLPGDELDARFVAYVLEHLYQSLLGRASLPSPAIFFPTPGVLGHSDAHALLALPHSVFRAMGLDVLAAAAAAVIALGAATWIVTFLFLRIGLRFPAFAALAGALVFVFSGPKLSQMSHVQHQVLVAIPAMAWCLVVLLESAARGEDRRAWWSLGLFSALLQLQLLTSFQIGWMWSFELAVVAAIACLRPRVRRAFASWIRAHARGIAVLALANAVAFIPFLALYLPVAARAGMRDWAMVAVSLPRPASYLLMGNSFLWGEASRRVADAVLLPLDWEQHLGFGIVGSALLLASFAWSLRRIARRGPDDLARPRSAPGRADLTMLACLGSLALFVLTLDVGGYSLWYGVWAALPGAAAIRTVSRYALVSSIGLALFCALAVERGLGAAARARAGRRRLAIAAITGLVAAFVAEQAGPPPSFDRTASDARVRALVADIEARPYCAVFAIAPRAAREATTPFQVDAMLASIETGRPTVNGYSSIAPADWRLWNLASPGYVADVHEWRTRHRLGNLCVLRGATAALTQGASPVDSESVAPTDRRPTGPRREEQR